VGYDGNADDDIDDAGDDLVVSSPFGSTAITPSHDDNGNLTDDGTYKYTYDAWNRLVKATLDDTDITIQEAEFDGLGRRIKKTVTNSGDLDGTTVYLYNRHQIIETRNGSDEVTLQVYPGTRYIDEVVGLRVKDEGRLYAHQAEGDHGGSLKDAVIGRLITGQGWALQNRPMVVGSVYVILPCSCKPDLRDGHFWPSYCRPVCCVAGSSCR
jgi:YD repeat-containing protein